MTRHNTPIQSVGVRNAVNAGISYPLDYEGYLACIECGLDLEKWYNNEYSVQFMESVIAIVRLRTHIKVHSEDARIEASKKKK